MTTWKIGELARATGLTVRTLHHYDEIGLLSPSQRTPAGHRLYSEEDVAALYRVAALRQLGFRLDQIAALTNDSGSPRALLAEHMFHVKRQVVAGQRLHARLLALALSLDRREKPSADDLLSLLEEMKMTDETINRYYTDEQLSWLAQRGEELGSDAIRDVEAEWPQLYARMQAEMDAGTDPADPKVQALLARMDELLAQFHGGRQDIRASLNQLWTEQSEQLVETYGGPSPELVGYLDRARQA